MKNQEHKDINNVLEVLDKINLLVSLKEKEARLKEVKNQIHKLEIAVIIIGLVALSLIVLPFFGIITFSILSILGIIGSIILIIKAFKDGEMFELEKFFLIISITTYKNKKEEDGEPRI
jgi:uncharacterized membrane protein